MWLIVEQVIQAAFDFGRKFQPRRLLRVESIVLYCGHGWPLPRPCGNTSDRHDGNSYCNGESKNRLDVLGGNPSRRFLMVLGARGPIDGLLHVAH